MDINSICPYVRQASQLYYIWKDTENQQAVDCRIFYILSGKGQFFVKDKFYDIGENTFIMFSPGTEYRFYFDHSKSLKNEIISINFDFYYNNSHIKTPIHPLPASKFDKSKIIGTHYEEPVVINNIVELKTSLLRLISEYHTKRPFYEGKASAVLKNIIVNAYRYRSTPHSSGVKTLAESVADYIATNYSSPLTINQIADEFNYHPYYLGKVFKNYYNKTILEYINETRLTIAKDIIIGSDFSLEEISHRVGYTNYSHFSYLFKNRFGISPTNLKKQSSQSLL